MKSKFIIGSLFIAIAGYFLGAEVFKEETNKTSQTSSKKLQVTASFYPLYYFASQIGGDKVNIANITPSGTEPHEYELTTQDRAKIENSRLLILNGGGLEVWADKINDDLKSKNVTVVTVGGDLITGKDPHIWLS
ncbi:MAG: metal ABC transporter substrate-binding protein, partial [Candidatus Curtissbacteria bacterium]|nr:metal ABC transporter substrate-binding protein [Candidatus Curtissbacteria bacterium]